MARVITDDSSLIEIADAIREKAGIAEQQDSLMRMVVMMVVMHRRRIFHLVSIAGCHHAAISRMAPCPRQLQRSSGHYHRQQQKHHHQHHAGQGSHSALCTSFASLCQE